MADNPYVNKVQLADGSTIMDISSDTVTPQTLLSGYTAHRSSGAAITGTVTIPDSPYDMLVTITEVVNELEGNTITADKTLSEVISAIGSGLNVGCAYVIKSSNSTSIFLAVQVDLATESTVYFEFEGYTINTRTFDPGGLSIVWSQESGEDDFQFDSVGGTLPLFGNMYVMVTFTPSVYSVTVTDSKLSTDCFLTGYVVDSGFSETNLTSPVKVTFYGGRAIFFCTSAPTANVRMIFYISQATTLLTT